MFKPTRPELNKRLVFDLIIVLILVGIGFAYRTTIHRFIRQQYNTLRPCSLPIVYAIGTIDPRFGVSTSTFIADIKESTALWEKPLHRTLFEFSTSTENADMLVNLEYDSRQQTTDTLQKIDSVIQGSTAQYTALRAQYESLLSEYNQDKAAFDALVSSFQAAKTAYENEVAMWNARGGAPASKRAELEQERTDLNNQIVLIQQKQTDLNALTNTLNATGNQLNAVIKDHNLNVRTYNAVGATTGDAFEEGVYVSNPEGRSITIFQFSDRNKFIRVLAHEFGHSLGLGHVDDPHAIMYKLNNDTAIRLTDSDLQALQAQCK